MPLTWDKTNKIREQKTIRWDENQKGRKKKNKKKEKEKKRRNKQKEEEGEPCVGGEEKEKKIEERHFPSRSPANRRSKCVGARDKIGSRDESYAWVPETAGFIAFQKVEFSPTLVPLNLRAVNGRVVQPQPWDWIFGRWDCFLGQFLGRV